MKNLLIILLLFVGFSASAQFKNNNRQIINVLNYGVVGDGRSFSDGVINSTTTFTSATASFVAATDVGKMIRITGAGAAGADLITTIASVSNSTTIILTVAASASGSAKAFDYGTNNTATLQAAANVIPTTGGIYYVPPGCYLKNGLLNFPNPTYITGDMSGRFGVSYDSAVSNTLRPRSKIIEISQNIPQSVTIQSGGSRWDGLDLTTTVGVQPSSGVGLNINADNVSIHNSSISGFWTAASQNYSGYWRMDHSSFAGIQYGLIIQNLRTADAGDWVITDCEIGGFVAHPASSGILMLSSGGGRISNCKWNVGLHKCISVEILSSASNTSDLVMTGNSLENYDSCAINIIANNSAVFSNIVINGNQIAPYSAHATGININGTGATFLKGISITANSLFNQNSGDTAIKLTAVQDVNLMNVINGNWTKQVYVDGTSTNVGYTASTQVATGTASNGFLGSANFTSSGTTTYVQDVLKIGNSTKTTPPFPELFSSFNNTANLSEMFINPSSGTNVAQSLNLVPLGTGLAAFKSGINLWGTNYINDQTNYNLGFIRMDGTSMVFVTTAAGSGTNVPMTFTTGTVPSIQIATSGTTAGNVFISGSESHNHVNVAGTGTYSALGTDYTIEFTGTTATLAYPTVNLVNGRELELINYASGSITIPSTKSGNAATITTLTTNQRAIVQYDLSNTTWIIKSLN